MFSLWLYIGYPIEQNVEREGISNNTYYRGYFNMYLIYMILGKLTYIRFIIILELYIIEDIVRHLPN